MDEVQAAETADTTSNAGATVGDVTTSADTGSVKGTPTERNEGALGVPTDPVGSDGVNPEHPSGDGSPTASDYHVGDFKLNGVSVDFTIPSEGVQMVLDAGLSIEDVAKEFKEGKLSEATLDKLYAKHGKFVIDSVVGNLNNDIKSVVDEYNAQLEEAFAKATEGIGGKEEWEKLEAFAETLDDSLIKSFNSAMASGDPYLQQVVIKDLHARMLASAPTVEPELILIEGSGAVGSGKVACSADEYKEAIASGEYNKNPVMWDNLRINGMRKGL